MSAAASSVEHNRLRNGSGGEPLDPAQEQVLAEVVQIRRSSAPSLRFAVIPLNVLRSTEPAVALEHSSARSQHYLRRVARDWCRRVGGRTDLIVQLDALASELRTLGRDDLAELASRGAAAGDEQLLIGALRLERELVRELRDMGAVVRFRAALELVLAGVTATLPPTPLERLDVERARLTARGYLIRSALPLAKLRASVVRSRSAMAYDDLVQIGSVAVVQAVDRFDPTYGVPLAAYAYPWIKQSLRRGERQADIISLPLRLQAAQRKVREALMDPAWVSVGAAQLAAHLGLSTRTVERVLDRQLVISLDGDGEGSIADTCADDKSPALEEHARIRERRVAVRRALDHCAARERDILRRLFGIDGEAEPAIAIARSHGITPQRVYQIRDAELRRLRHPSVAADLAQYL